MKLKNCCCCINLETGHKILAWLFVISGILGTVGSIYILAQGSQPQKVLIPKSQLDDNTRKHLETIGKIQGNGKVSGFDEEGNYIGYAGETNAIDLIVYISTVIVGIILLRGIARKSTALIKIYIAYLIIGSVIGLYKLHYLANDTPVMIMSMILYIAIEGYFILLGFSLHSQYKQF